MSISYKATPVLNVSKLFSIKAKHDDVFQTLGYTTKGVGGNLYRYDATSSATPDGGFTLPGIGGTLSFSGTTFNGTAGTGRFISIDQSIADVTKFGALGDGSDDAAEVQLAAKSLQSTGGLLYFPPGRRYRIDSEVLCESNFAISIKSEMGVSYTNGNVGGFIYSGADRPSTSIFKMDCSGGTISGLYFKDPTSTLGSAQGTNRVRACIHGAAYSCGIVQGCWFDGIKGSCVEANEWVRGRINDIHARDSGDTGRSVIHLVGVDINHPAQALVIQGAHIEVCYGGPYIYVGADAPDVKIIGAQMETDELIPASQQTFIEVNSLYSKIVGCEFTVNDLPHILVGASGARCQISACSFTAASPVAVPKIQLDANYCIIENCNIAGAPVDNDYSIIDNAGYNLIRGVVISNDGGIAAVDKTIISGCFIDLCRTTQDYAISTATDVVVDGCVVTRGVTCGGIRVASGASLTGSMCTSNAGVGIRCVSSVSSVMGNRATNNTGGDIIFDAYPRSYSPNSNYAGDGNTPLQTSLTYDPAAIPGGQSISFNVTLSGVASGDTALVNFPVIASGSSVSGISVTGATYNSNNVKVTIANNTASSINLDSGTLTIKAFKA